VYLHSLTRSLMLASFLIALRGTLDASPARHSDASQSTPQSNQDLQTILRNYVRSVLPTHPADIRDVETLAAQYQRELRPEGTWADIDYSDDTRASWKRADHLQRTLVMAKSASLMRRGSQHDSVLDTAVIRALGYWLKQDYINPNWWWNQIGVPELVGEIASLMQTELSSDMLAQTTTVMQRSEWKRIGWTGANLTWGVAIEIVRGCLNGDEAAVAEGYSRMYEEIRYVSPKEEGIQQDDSFHQHGTQLYNGGYGLTYANDVGRFIAFAWDTRFQIPADQMKIFSAYLLDGEQWMIRGDVFDYAAIGREITREGKVAVPHDWTVGPISPAGPAYSLGNVVSMLAKEPTPRQKEFQEFAARLDQSSTAVPFEGNKQFWLSDFMVHRRKGFSTSVKMLSNRMLNGEQVNSEGKKSHHLSDGLNLLYLTGDEYRDILPVWDWTKLPGTTAIQGTLETGETNPTGVRGKTSFAGGVSDGKHGLAAMELDRGDLRANKAWFFFDKGYLCLGSGVTLTNDTTHDVVTDINQSLLHGPVYSNSSAAPLTTGQYNTARETPSWVYHAGVGYIVGERAHVSLSVGPQTGSWSEIGSGSSEQLSVPVFDLWIDHGPSPNNATYEYFVAPSITRTQLVEESKNPTIVILANTDAIQAAYDKNLKLVEAAFRIPGEIPTPVGNIRVDATCLLLVRQEPRVWRVTAANPQNQPLVLSVTINDAAVKLTLPAGNAAGSSVSLTINRQ
jgi:chondroitin AC lyase